MFWNIYGKKLLIALRDRDMAFWTWLFPILLSTLFFFSFSTLDSADQFRSVKTAIVSDGAYNENVFFKTAVESVSAENDSQMLSVTFVENLSEADELLKNGDVSGYIFIENGVPKLAITDNGLDQTILKGFLDSYIQIETRIRTTGKYIVPSTEEFTEEISFSKNPPSNTVTYYYALLAMVCMYGCFQGLNSITYYQANLSSMGARRIISPVSRFKLLLYDLLGGITVHFASIILVVAYIILLFGINFGPNIGYVMLICFMGTLVGVAMGALVSVFSKMNVNFKTAVLISVSMVCCFLSGLMVGGMNYIIARNFPLLSWINPAARITDAFYSLYYYDTYDKFFLNIGILAVMAAVMFTITSFFLRRRQYESI